jgi:hypothetical protein
VFELARGSLRFTNSVLFHFKTFRLDKVQFYRIELSISAGADQTELVWLKDKNREATGTNSTRCIVFRKQLDTIGSYTALAHFLRCDDSAYGAYAWSTKSH